MVSSESANTNPSVSLASVGELESTESQDILLMKRDLALHNSVKASIFSFTFAEVAELVDAHDSGSCGGHLVEVRVLSSASEKQRLGDILPSLQSARNRCLLLGICTTSAPQM